MRPRFRIPVLLVTFVVVQAIVLRRLRIEGAHPELLLIVPLAAGLAGGRERGAAMGFAAGLLADLFLLAPFGLSALVYSVLGFTVGAFRSGILRSTWWIPVAIAAGGSALGVVGYALVSTVVGQTQMIDSRLAVVAAVVCILNAPLSIAAIPLVTWALGDDGLSRSYAGS